VLAYLHGPRQALTHGAVRAEHCMLLPKGQLFLFDFGMAAPATDATRYRDTRDLAVMLYRLLTGFEQEGDRLPPVRVFAPEVTVATDQVLRKALYRTVDGTLLTAVDLRRQLMECCQNLGISTSICPYCQATTRAQARHCGSCGSTLWRETAARAPENSPPGSAAPVARPPGAQPGAPVTPSTSDAASALQSAERAAPPTTPMPVQHGRSQTIIGPDRSGRSRRLIATYTNRLRGIGRFIDQQGLRRVTIVDSGTGILIRGQTDGVGRLADAAPRSVVAALISADELEELCVQAPQRRNQHHLRTQHRSGGLLGSLLFPTGYENRLRAIGSELDGLTGVSLPTIIETIDCLYLDYDRVDETQTSRSSHRHVVLSNSDVETILAAATARRGRGKGGHSLQAMIQREGPRG
jgi:hypothetical protein